MAEKDFNQVVEKQRDYLRELSSEDFIDSAKNAIEEFLHQETQGALDFQNQLLDDELYDALAGVANEMAVYANELADVLDEETIYHIAQETDDIEFHFESEPVNEMVESEMKLDEWRDYVIKLDVQNLVQQEPFSNYDESFLANKLRDMFGYQIFDTELDEIKTVLASELKEKSMDKKEILSAFTKDEFIERITDGSSTYGEDEGVGLIATLYPKVFAMTASATQLYQDAQRQLEQLLDDEDFKADVVEQSSNAQEVVANFIDEYLAVRTQVEKPVTEDVFSLVEDKIIDEAVEAGFSGRGNEEIFATNDGEDVDKDTARYYLSEWLIGRNKIEILDQLPDILFYDWAESNSVYWYRDTEEYLEHFDTKTDDYQAQLETEAKNGIVYVYENERIASIDELMNEIHEVALDVPFDYILEDLSLEELINSHYTRMTKAEFLKEHPNEGTQVILNDVQNVATNWLSGNLIYVTYDFDKAKPQDFCDVVEKYLKEYPIEEEVGNVDAEELLEKALQTYEEDILEFDSTESILEGYGWETELQFVNDVKDDMSNLDFFKYGNPVTAKEVVDEIMRTVALNLDNTIEFITIEHDYQYWLDKCTPSIEFSTKEDTELDVGLIRADLDYSHPLADINDDVKDFSEFEHIVADVAEQLQPEFEKYVAEHPNDENVQDDFILEYAPASYIDEVMYEKLLNQIMMVKKDIIQNNFADFMEDLRANNTVVCDENGGWPNFEQIFENWFNNYALAVGTEERYLSRTIDIRQLFEQFVEDMDIYTYDSLEEYLEVWSPDALNTFKSKVKELFNSGKKVVSEGKEIDDNVVWEGILTVLDDEDNMLELHDGKITADDIFQRALEYYDIELSDEDSLTEATIKPQLEAYVRRIVYNKLSGVDVQGQRFHENVLMQVFDDINLDETTKALVEYSKEEGMFDLDELLTSQISRESIERLTAQKYLKLFNEGVDLGSEELMDNYPKNMTLDYHPEEFKKYLEIHATDCVLTHFLDKSDEQVIAEFESTLE